MRFVDVSKLDVPDGWHDKAGAAVEALLRATNSAERKEVLKKYRHVWAELKPSLEHLSNKKCWYCEAKQIRSDRHVDHFRPKSTATPDPECGVEGYWWVAFEISNYRYSCTFCNSVRLDEEHGTSGGKGDKFPLRRGTRRCTRPEESLLDEQPVLLDPTVQADPLMLWFELDGSVRPVCDEKEEAWPFERAQESIQIYHLDHVDLKEARQAVSQRCRSLVTAADRAWVDYCSGSLVAYQRFQDKVREISELISPKAEYSAAAISTLMGLRGGRSWLASVLHCL
jgi:uncharacterized protein (TIGR02646 family)